jgi:hypothetical protein
MVMIPGSFAHGELVQDVMVADGACCERCPGATAANTSHIARRRLLKAAVFQPPPAGSGQAESTGHLPRAARKPPPHRGAADRQAWAHDVGTDMAGMAPIRPDPAEHLYRSVTGQITDITPHFVAIGDARGDQRFILSADATAWRGAPVEPSTLNPGDRVVIRLRPPRHTVADRIWADIGRVTGTIVEREADRLLVDEGATRPQRVVVIPRQASGRIQVKFPRLRPGFLIDVIGLRGAGELQGLVPAAYQPTYPVAQLQPPVLATGRFPDTIAGSATWHDAVDEPYGVLGVAYPAVDPATGCAEDAAAGLPHGPAPAFRSLPYLAIGSALAVRNQCTGLSCDLPVTGCAPVARLFNDRCVTCRVSPRGRVADLTMASYIALGGELEQGCFFATIAIGV